MPDLIPTSDQLDFSPETIEINETSEATANPDSGIEILVKMAEKNEIDPKNVDIIDVCDKFLKAIAASPKESLRISGKVLFHAAVLLRLKAEALLSEANRFNSPIDDDFMDFDDQGGPILYDAEKQVIARQLTFKDLEGAIVRRAKRKQVVRERRVTLEELIEALREAEKADKKRQERKPKGGGIDLSGHIQVNDVDDILHLAHDEDIEETIVRVEQWIIEHLVAGQQIELFDLIKQIARDQDWVETFLSALFLSNAGKIDLHQDTFYGPLYLAIPELAPVVTSDKNADFSSDPEFILKPENNLEAKASATLLAQSDNLASGLQS
ncbi:MAG: segregation/condensation protein A [Candidatus Melainabacteria bacterium]|nr:segregation/condensation protein A [Candidatus Melainabacteria bacterium]MBX9673103.1 segregation/condensation protein A [Candidatus Obscuribacterales bacterium]